MSKSIDEFIQETAETHNAEQHTKFLNEVYLQACDYVRHYEQGTPAWEKAQDMLSQNNQYEAYTHWRQIKQDFEASQFLKAQNK